MPIQVTMKQEQIDKYRKAADDGTIPDAENPLFLFSGIPDKLLVMGLNKEFSFTELAKMELANRGFNIKGEWIGFDQAGRNVNKHKRPGKSKRP